MKKIVLTFGAIIISTFVLFAQSDVGFKYQAIFKSPNGKLIPNKEISMLQNSKNGDVIYSETHKAITNALGWVYDKFFFIRRFND